MEGKYISLHLENIVSEYVSNPPKFIEELKEKTKHIQRNLDHISTSSTMTRIYGKFTRIRVKRNYIGESYFIEEWYLGY